MDLDCGLCTPPLPNREKAAFAQFGSDLDKATQMQLARGERLTEMLKQPQYQPMPVVDQVLALFAATKGGLDEQELDAVKKFEEEFLVFMRTRHSAQYDKINEAKDIPKEDEEALLAALKEFIASFTP